MECKNLFFKTLCEAAPVLKAEIRGGSAYPDMAGCAYVYEVAGGVLFSVEISGMPYNPVNNVPYFLGMHIHEKGDCSRNFENTGMHYNPYNTVHPHHRGDLPSILNNNGYAYMVFYDEFLSVNEIVNRSIIIHADRDDFTSQPAGNSGNKIGCGVFKRI